MNELDKLKHIIHHWEEHNEEHIESYRQWADKAETAGQKDVAEALRKIAEESTKLNDLFKKAQGLL